MKAYFLFIITCMTSSLCVASTQLLHIDTLKNTQNAAEVVLASDTRLQYHLFTLSAPHRIVLDLKNTRLRARYDHRYQKHTLLQRIRHGFPAPGILRLVFEVPEHVRAAIIPTRTPVSQQKTLHIRFTSTLQKPYTSLEPLRATKHTIHKPSLPPQKTTMRDIIVVLDPGHGGKDPGAIGAKGTQEKHITLAIARELKYTLDRKPGLRAVLTRQTDHFISLRERLRIARQHNADLFVSIHADAFIDAQAKGVSVFTLSERGATSEAARWLAEKENYSELGGVNLTSLHDTTGIVRSVLIDLSQTATINASVTLGGRILGHLSQITHVHKKKVEQARFMVLKSPDIPSVLIETGYISNPHEERNLSGSHYQKKISFAIAQGVAQYFSDHPPPDSFLATHIKKFPGGHDRARASRLTKPARLALAHTI